MNESGVRCRWQDRPAESDGAEQTGEPPPPGAIRLELRYIKGMRREAAERIEAEQAARRFVSIEDLAGRCRLRRNELVALASVGALPARGLLFLTLEDETGMSQAIVMPDQLKKHRRTIVSSSGLIVEGVLQKKDGSLSVKADKFWPIDRLERVPSHDFR